MPELPEVETIARQLHQALVGQKIKNITVLRAKSFQGEVHSLIGKRITEVTRQAKVIIIRLAPGSLSVIVHLKMTGQLILQKAVSKQGEKDRIVGGHPTLDWIKQLPSQHTRVIIDFQDKSRLFFNDMRVFGWIKVMEDQHALKAALKHFHTIEPLHADFTVMFLERMVMSTARSIKTVLMDQHQIAGIGNIYANDALFDAGIDPKRKANSLTPSEIKKLYTSINTVMKLGIETGGATDSHYRQLDGMGGQYQNYFLVYRQNGKPCTKCGSIIVKTKIGGRGTFYCPRCQR